MKRVIFILSTFFISLSYVYSQSNVFDCEFFNQQGTNNVLGNPFGGRVKPNRTDRSGGGQAPEDAYFPVLVVFVQFKGEPSDPRGTWPQDSVPIYLNNMISRIKKDQGNWWQFYNPQTEILSSHWAEISRGLFHVISPVPELRDTAVFSVVLSKTAQEYFEFYNYDKYRADSAIHCDIWGSVRSQGLTDWRPYDRWKKVDSLFYSSWTRRWIHRHDI